MDNNDNQDIEFNDEQKAVINFGKGSLLVEAGPGSGKTTVIVARIKKLIEDGVDPESFLVITFSTKAADNLKNKLRETLSNDIVLKMQISTVHSFCLEYLKSKNHSVTLIDDEASEKKNLFIQKFRKELGFVNESTVLDYHIPAVLNKFGEYTCFNVDTEKLIEKITDSRVITKDYLDFVDSLDYFSKKRIDDHDKPIKKLKNKKSDEYDEKDEFSKSWYNARYLQIAKAYPKYLKLLDDYKYVDYDTLQLKALRELEKDSETRFKTIFVDEFQDTDPLQYRIFEILRADCEYFTAVGDVDQHIYAFRSSFNDFFDESIRLNHLDSLSLDVNYRSCENIVKLTEGFIQCRRKETSQKHMCSAGKPYNNPNFLIENNDSDDEAKMIYDIVRDLKDKKQIRDSDIAILYRKHSDDTISNLINLFKQDDDIDFTIRGQSDLPEQSEIKSAITMMWYVSRKTHYGYVPSADELDIKKELNLTAFCHEYFTPALDKSTWDYLCCLQQSYYDKLMEIQKNHPKREGDGVAKAVHTIKKNKTQDTLTEIFKQIEMPAVDLDMIQNERDRQFFKNLNDMRRDINLENQPTVLEVFYRILSLMDYFDDVGCNHKQMANLALVSQTISNYESFISETDVRGALFFIRNAIGNYDSHKEDDGGVQLMTIHAAKGLEFPVTIITSLQKDKFPMANKDEKREKDYIFPNDTYYTPNECLEYKTILKEKGGKWDHETITIDEENELNDAEEDRILYVAMTRAADLLILSSIGEVPEQIERIRDYTTPFNFDDLGNVTICGGSGDSDDETTVLNYSKYTQYCSCQFKYYLGSNFGFARPGRKAANRGTVFHDIMEKTNIQLMECKVLSEDNLIDLIRKEYSLKFDIDENPEEFEEFKRNVICYYNKYSVNREVLAAELDFEIDRDNYLFNGAIDLIYKTGENEIVILDYKYACSGEEKLDGYTKQLHLYAAALKELPEYKDYTIKKAITHFVRNDDPHEVEITDEIIRKELESLDNVACQINDSTHLYVKDGDNCEKCQYRAFCKKLTD